VLFIRKKLFLYNAQCPYQALGVFIGYGLYAPRIWCDSTAFFIGSKIGFTSRRALAFSTALHNTIAFDTDIGIAYGLQSGFTWFVYPGISLDISGEMIVNSYSRRYTHITMRDGRCESASPVGLELFFPITCSIKYIF
jgi:hypothetical protein